MIQYYRQSTREVYIGEKALGGKNPIRIQSMTNTNPSDLKATTKQIIELYYAGCDYVRLTIPSIKVGENLKEIKKNLKLKGLKIPLIADVHFNPKIAEVAAQYIEKVRINPGNYSDKRKAKAIEYSETEYNDELNKIMTHLKPLLRICKQNGTALRIGTNHGSLSDRIMNKYGDTAVGMVESALEFVRICIIFDFHNIVLSMKSSNPKIMIEAYRLLVAKMREENMNYPIHLGVTEAGVADDGIIKSAIGIGTLLEDGIGDTIRVSLTGNPVNEVPVAKRIIERYSKRKSIQKPIEAFQIKDFKSISNSLIIRNIGGSNPPVVISDLSNLGHIDDAFYRNFGCQLNSESQDPNIAINAPDYFYIGKQRLRNTIPEQIKIISDLDTWQISKRKSSTYPLFTSRQYLSESTRSVELNFVLIEPEDNIEKLFNLLRSDKTAVFILKVNNNSIHESRKIIIRIRKEGINNPVIFRFYYDTKNFDNLKLNSAIDYGALQIDKLGDGIFLSSLSHNTINLQKNINQLSFDILQGSKRRIFKTEYIICPSCGRTLFDIEKTAKTIQEKTSHLKGLKIGIMGCVINGIGEMGDVDYGYVGISKDRVSLYKNKQLVKKNVKSEDALQELIKLIKTDNKWITTSKRS